MNDAPEEGWGPRGGLGSREGGGPRGGTVIHLSGSGDLYLCFIIKDDGVKRENLASLDRETVWISFVG